MTGGSGWWEIAKEEQESDNTSHARKNLALASQLVPVLPQLVM